MTKPRSAFICQNCGYAASKWLGRCPDCGEWNSIVEELVHPLGAKKPGGTLGGSSAATPFHEVSSQEYTRFSSGLPEFDRVLGGGIVPGSLVLLEETQESASRPCCCKRRSSCSGTAGGCCTCPERNRNGRSRCVATGWAFSPATCFC